MFVWFAHAHACRAQTRHKYCVIDLALSRGINIYLPASKDRELIKCRGTHRCDARVLQFDLGAHLAMRHSRNMIDRMYGCFRTHRPAHYALVALEHLGKLRGCEARSFMCLIKMVIREPRALYNDRRTCRISSTVTKLRSLSSEIRRSTFIHHNIESRTQVFVWTNIVHAFSRKIVLIISKPS